MFIIGVIALVMVGYGLIVFDAAPMTGAFLIGIAAFMALRILLSLRKK